MDLGNNERRMLRAMLSDSSREWTLGQLLSETGWEDQVHVAGAGKKLEEEGLLELSESSSRMVSLGDEGQRASENGLLESRLWGWMSELDGEKRTMKSLMSSDFDRAETGPGIGILKGLGIEIESGSFIISDESKISQEIDRRSEFILSLSESAVESSNLDSEMLSHFSSRSGLLIFEDVTIRTWKLTKSGSSFDPSSLEETKLIGEVTPEMLQTESWIGAEFKPFDVEAPAPMPTGGRRHPMQSLIERIRSVFLEMGFSEIEGDYVQSAGWNMDSLFIPQSHPARTMQDTFYLNQPRNVEVDEEYLDLWSRVHEHGHDTGSK
mgnify:FL=1